MQRRHDPTYYCATMRLPRHVRPAVHALYGFVRGADQLVDGPRRPPDAAARRRALDRWQAELEKGMASGRSRHPVIAALVDAGRRHDLPLAELSVYMDSMRLDCGPVRLATQAELDNYMRGSAEAVGLIMAFYLVHQRYWAVAYDDVKAGDTVLWIGTSADKNREHFQERFDELAKNIREQVGAPARELTHA